jgi:hypothetical protein
MDLWSLLRVVSQRSLRSCRIAFDDRPIERAALFPLFNDAGHTQMVMITAQESRRIMVADWAPGLFVRDWAWRNRLHLRSTDLNDASMWDDEHVDELWHFDPWWVLGDERYRGHAAVPALRNTNIPGYDPTISDIVFDSDLGRASYVARVSADSLSIRRFSADSLAEVGEKRRSARDRPRVAAAVGWQLRPFWPCM